jgi:1-aminocyclopropane-1-carboxylate deaminase/D-cysteine desulfhydrase-like pyridoxal-dependent ACC family enzyme
VSTRTTAERRAAPHATGLAALPSVPLFMPPTPVEEMPRLRDALGARVRLLVKRDDAISFGFGGNKVRKLQLVVARALEEGADTLVTTGGVQSNHARATAAAAAKLGLGCTIIANGAPPERPTANAFLDQLLGAEVQYVATREERAPAIQRAVERLRAAGKHPFAIPLGASTPVGAAAFALAVTELLAQMPAPDVIVHASSSGGTQAGLVAGCALHGLATRVIGVSADDPAESIGATVRRLVGEIAPLAGSDPETLLARAHIEVDDGFVGAGYGVPSDASREAQRLAATTEALFVDHTYTAKAFAALIDGVRRGRFADGTNVLFWHTGGQVGLFA